MSVKNKSQEIDVINHLTKYKKITALQAIKKYGCTRLSSVIYILRKKGFAIETEIINIKNRYGHNSPIAVYHLKE